jgi:membrane associated rhomboid family serine protease
MQSPFANLTTVVKNLIIINVIFYIAMFALHDYINMVGIFSAFYFDSPLFKPWQVITYMFMHDPNNIGHIFFNMFALFSFGPILEHTLGSKKFFNLYFAAGIGGLLLHVLVQAVQIYGITGGVTLGGMSGAGMSPEKLEVLKGLYTTPILGASGAIFGILVAFGMLFPNMEMMIMFIPVPIKAKYVVIGYVAIELFSGFGRFEGDSVAHFAHLGGALFGFILIKIWGLKSTNNYY